MILQIGKVHGAKKCLGVADEVRISWKAIIPLNPLPEVAGVIINIVLKVDHLSLSFGKTKNGRYRNNGHFNSPQQYSQLQVRHHCITTCDPLVDKDF